MKDNEKLIYFYGIVKQMRDAQKNYFSQRSEENLLIAKKFERKVDAMTDLFYNPRLNFN